MENELICVYCNSLGVSSIQHLVNIKIQESDKGYIEYIQGWSPIVSAFRTLRGDRVVEQCDTIEDAEILLADFDKKPEEYGYKDTADTYHISRPDTFDICFTGFKKADREELTEQAKENGINIHVSVVKHLDMLCYGYNAGPVKLKKALSQGALIANRKQFENFLETGEIPEDV